MESHSPAGSPVGFIKLWRSSLQHHLFKLPHVWHYFQFCLMKANWEEAPKQHNVSGKTVNTHYAEFISTLRNDAEDTGLSYQQIRTAQRRLEKDGMLTRQPTHHCTVIRLTNFKRFQSEGRLTQHTSQHTGNTRVTHGQHIYKNSKNNKNKKNINRGKSHSSENKLSEKGQNYLKHLRNLTAQKDQEDHDSENKAEDKA